MSSNLAAVIAGTYRECLTLENTYKHYPVEAVRNGGFLIYFNESEVESEQIKFKTKSICR